MEKTKRIILDTNWYISASISKKSRRTFYKLLTDKRFTILFSDELLKEYLAVIRRDKFAKIIKPTQYQRFIKIILPQLEQVTIVTDIALSRDEKDNYLLAMSIDGNADYLITGDLDLLVLENIKSTKIVNAVSFLNEFYDV